MRRILEGFSDTHVSRAESIFISSFSSREISGDPPRFVLKNFSGDWTRTSASMVSPRYCKSVPLNFTMRSAYRCSIRVSRAHNDSILIRKELRFAARYTLVEFPFRLFIDRHSGIAIVSRYGRQEERAIWVCTDVFSHRRFCKNIERSIRSIRSGFYRLWIRNRVIGHAYLFQTNFRCKFSR